MLVRGGGDRGGRANINQNILKQTKGKKCLPKNVRNRLLLCRSHQITENVKIDLQSLVDFDLQNFEIINQRRKTSLKRVFKSYSR